MTTHNIPLSIFIKKFTLNYLKSAAMGFFQGTQERVRNSRGKQAISVRATEVLLYIFHFIFLIHKYSFKITLSLSLMSRASRKYTYEHTYATKPRNWTANLHCQFKEFVFIMQSTAKYR